MRIASFIVILSLAFGFSSLVADTDFVNVYSARKENLIKPLLDKFTENTGIKVNLVTAQADALLTRLESEKEHSPADLLITTDAGRLYRAQNSNLLDCTQIPEMDTLVPVNYRHKQGCWYALSLRSRTIMLVKDKLNPSMVPTYESLSDPRWKGKICVRSSNNIYNQSLVASMLAHSSKAKTVTWLKGLVNNFARSPAGGDRDQILAAAAGLCDIVIANTYYLAMMLDSNNEQQSQAAQKMLVTWPNQNNRGAHVNVSGAGVIKTAPNKQNAKRLLQYLASDEAQDWYARVNHEYPIRKNVPVPALLKAWGHFKTDKLNLSQLGKLNTDAVKLMDQAGWQ